MLGHVWVGLCSLFALWAPASALAALPASHHMSGASLAAAQRIRDNPMLDARVLMVTSPDPANAAPLLNAAPGITALAGRVVDQAGHGLVNTTVSDGGQTSVTDAEGRFLLSNVEPGHSVLVLDARQAASGDYGYYEIAVIAVKGRTVPLPYTSWLPRVDHAHDVVIASPTRAETVITNPAIPGMELHIPKGAVITGPDGKPVTRISITPMPSRHTPYPMPSVFQSKTYFTIQPGGSTISGANGEWLGARLVYPNWHHGLPHAREQFWWYQPDRGGWGAYGNGSVSKDAKQIIPDDGTEFYDFTGASVNDHAALKVDNNADGGDPVDLGSGLWIDKETDLSVADVMPINLTRTYRPMESAIWSFGVGTRLPWDMMLHGFNAWPAGDQQNVTLVLDDGGVINFQAPSQDIGQSQYGWASDPWGAQVFVSQTTPGKYYNATLIYLGYGAGLQLVLQDGTTYNFVLGRVYEYVLQSIADRFGNTITITRDINDSVTQVTSPNGRFIQFTYDTNSQTVITSATDSAGRTVSYTYDQTPSSHGAGCTCRLIQMKDADGNSWTYGWGNSDNGYEVKTSIADPHGHLTLQNQYYPISSLFVERDMVQTQTLIDGSEYQFSYLFDPTNSYITQTTMSYVDATNTNMNYTRVVTFNSAGYSLTDQTTSSSATPRYTVYTRDSGNHITNEAIYNQLPGSNGSLPASLDETGWAFNANGYVSSVTVNKQGPSSITATKYYTYSPYFNQIAQIVDENGYVTTYGVNTLGEITSITNGTSGDTRSISYNSDGTPYQVAELSNGGTATTTYNYDHGLVSSVVDPLGRTMRYYRDAVGRVVQATDPLGNVTKTQYDPLYGVKKVTDPLGYNVSTFYTEIGDVETFTDQNGNVTKYDYDVRDNLYRREDPLGAYTYYKSYDGMRHPLSVTDRNGNVSSYTWDSYGNFLTGSYADGTSTSFTWDSLGRLTSASDSAAGTLTRTWSSVRTYIDKYSSGSVVKGTVQPVWDVNGLPLKMTVLGPDNNALLYSYGFDSAKRFSSESATNQSSSVSITYDTADRRYQETLPDGIVATYAYDNADELTSITYMNGTTSVGTLTYSYDADGRVSSRGGTLFQAILPSGNALPTSATYDVDNRLTAWTTASGSTKPSYDANGNQICDNYNSSTSSCTGRTLTWDKRNRLTQVSSGGSTLASYSYDALDRRISVTSGGTTTATLYDTFFDPVQDQVGSTVTANIWTGLGVDERFARTTTAGTSTYLTDALGSTMSLASSSGAVQTSYGYDPTGNTTTSGTAKQTPTD